VDPFPQLVRVHPQLLGVLDCEQRGSRKTAHAVRV
jgi:hypothetical protein